MDGDGLWFSAERHEYCAAVIDIDGVLSIVAVQYRYKLFSVERYDCGAAVIDMDGVLYAVLVQDLLY